MWDLCCSWRHSRWQLIRVMGIPIRKGKRGRQIQGWFQSTWCAKKTTGCWRLMSLDTWNVWVGIGWADDSEFFQTCLTFDDKSSTDKDNDELFWNCHPKKEWSHKICHVAEEHNQLKTCKCHEENCIKDATTVGFQMRKETHPEVSESTRMAPSDDSQRNETLRLSRSRPPSVLCSSREVPSCDVWQLRLARKVWTSRRRHGRRADDVHLSSRKLFQD